MATCVNMKWWVLMLWLHPRTVLRGKSLFLKRMHLNNGYWIGDVLVGKYAIWDVEHTSQPASCLDMRNKKYIKEH